MSVMNNRIRGSALLLFVLNPLATPALSSHEGAQKAETQKQEEGKDQSKPAKTHFAQGNQAMSRAKSIRQQVDLAPAGQKPALLAQMKAHYQTAVTEYEQALQDTKVRDENGVHVIGLLGLIRTNGLVSREQAVDMLVQDKELPTILSNLGMAHGGLGEYEQAVSILEQAAIMKPAANTEMELGTDLAHLGKISEATSACERVISAEPAAKEVQATCYKNVAIVLINDGKAAEAAGPLQKAVQSNPQDAIAWKLLGDALSAAITTKSERGESVYVIPPGTVEAYQRYLQLQPTGPYAAQSQAALDGLVRLAKSAGSPPTDAKQEN